MIGKVQKSQTSLETQEYRAKVVYIDHKNLAVYTTLAIDIVSSTLREATFFLHYTNNLVVKDKKTRDKIHESKLAMEFIQGTGLDIMIKFYNLDYDPEKIRELFNQTFHIK